VATPPAPTPAVSPHPRGREEVYVRRPSQERGKRPASARAPFFKRRDPAPAELGFSVAASARAPFLKRRDHAPVKLGQLLKSIREVEALLFPAST
jgi:hypothetical protein